MRHCDKGNKIRFFRPSESFFYEVRIQTMTMRTICNDRKISWPLTYVEDDFAEIRDLSSDLEKRFLNDAY